MSKQKPALVKGTRDYGPPVMLKRNFIISHIRTVFERFGFLPLETPAMETLAVLTGKYGEEGDQLLYKILNSGDFLKPVETEDIAQGAKHLSYKISEKGLRYDLTVPMARFVAMNQNDLAFPFKRYQIQPVWRGDSPQKGRYREFYQCDADAVGTPSLICEAEIVVMIKEVMQRLGIDQYVIKINHRKVLSAISQQVGATALENALFVAIDKLDKIGKEKVLEELSSKGFSDKSLHHLKDIFEISSKDIFEKLQLLENQLQNNSIGLEGIQEIRKILDYVHNITGESASKLPIELDLTLARGLAYYTGSIFEVKALNTSIGSISGGGRYDHLTESFGTTPLTGVGFSLGLDRIYDVMEEKNLFPPATQTTTRLLLTNFESRTEGQVLSILQKIREAGINAEMYPEPLKLDKQLKYASKKQIPFVLLIGPEELASGQLTLKNMQEGSQQKLSIEQLIDQFA